MKKRDIKDVKKEIVKIMKKKDFTFYYKNDTDLSPTKKGTFSKLVKKISKKYNTIVVLNSDKVLIHDIHTDMYELTDCDKLNREYDNIIIEADTVVLIQETTTKDFSINDALSLYNNFIHSNKSKNKVLFYQFFLSKDRLFDHCLSDSNVYETHNQKMYKIYPDFIQIRDAYKNKSLKERNLFCSYIERFIETSRHTLLMNLGLTNEEGLKYFDIKFMGGEQLTNLYKENKIDKDLFNKFISELFMSMYHWTYESLLGFYINALYYELSWRLIKYAKNARERNIIKIDSKVDTKNKSIMIYELLNNEGCDGIGVSVTFTFDKLYDMIVKKGEEDKKNINGRKSFALDSEPMDSINGESNLISFPMKAEGKCSDLENCLILFEKALYNTDRKNYTIKKMDEIHQMFFERRSSTRYLFTRKCTKSFSDDLFTMKNVHLLFLASSVCLNETIKDFARDMFTMIVTASLNEYGNNINYDETKENYNVEIIDYDSYNEKIRFKMTKKINNEEIGTGGFNISIKKIQSYIKSILEK